MWINILIAVAAIAVLFVIIVATRPGEFRVMRSTTISAPAQAVFAQVNDFHSWKAWSPWEKMDPALKRTYEGPPAGVGAVYSWVGNKKVGEGRMTLTESRPSDLIRIKLEFFKPFAATNSAEFTFKPQRDQGREQTAVTWTMSGGKNSFMCKAFSMFINMDKMIGRDFEKGLASMKTLVELKN